MCVLRNRWGQVGLESLTEDAKQALELFGEDRRKQIDADPLRGLRGIQASGWRCPNCGSAHAPDVHTCPEPPRGGGLRDRLKAARE